MFNGAVDSRTVYFVWYENVLSLTWHTWFEVCSIYLEHKHDHVLQFIRVNPCTGSLLCYYIAAVFMKHPGNVSQGYTQCEIQPVYRIKESVLLGSRSLDQPSHCPVASHNTSLSGCHYRSVPIFVWFRNCCGVIIISLFYQSRAIAMHCASGIHPKDPPPPSQIRFSVKRRAFVFWPRS
jgi:hypothetical protein